MELTDSDLKLIAEVFRQARFLADETDNLISLLDPVEDEILCCEAPNTDVLRDALHRFAMKASFTVPE